jgi:large subunit ribosomal protein L30
MDGKSKDELIAIVRIRGRVNVRRDITETLERLHLKRVNNCIVLKMSPAYEGMLNKCVNYVSYGEIDAETLGKLLGRHAEGFDPKEVISGKADMAKLKERMPFRLHPPRHGFRSTKLSVKQGGDLGYKGAGINALIKRMV